MDSFLAPAIAFALSQLILSVVLLTTRKALTVQQSIYLILLFSVAAYLLGPLVESTAVEWLFTSIAVAVPGTFWLFCISLFDDHFKLRAWQVGAVAFTVVLPLVALILHGVGVSSLGFMLITIPQTVEFVLLGLALYVVARHWHADLVESRRRLRLWFCGVNGVYIFVFVLFREVLFPEAQWLHSLQYLPVGLLLLVTNAIFLCYKSSIWAPGVVVSQASNISPINSAVISEVDEPVAVDPQTVARIEALMERDKIYREMGLTIGQLALRLRVPEYRLRRIINAGLGYRNFNDFLNQYRIKEAAQRLADPEQQRLQILVIALDIGFRTLSSFNKAFKEHFQLTPTAFRRQHLNGVDDQRA